MQEFSVGASLGITVFHKMIGSAALLAGRVVVPGGGPITIFTIGVEG